MFFFPLLKSLDAMESNWLLSGRRCEFVLVFALSMHLLAMRSEVSGVLGLMFNLNLFHSKGTQNKLHTETSVSPKKKKSHTHEKQLSKTPFSFFFSFYELIKPLERVNYYDYNLQRQHRNKQKKKATHDSLRCRTKWHTQVARWTQLEIN